MNYKYPVYVPQLGGNEKKYVLDCIDSTWISSKGKYVNDFEDVFAKYIGTQFATGVCNGTVALHLAMLALGITSEDEVIVPTFTYIASVNAIAYNNAKPIFVDSLADTWQMDPKDIARKVTPKTKAILCVHLYGHPCDMEAIMKIAKEHNLFVIEDCAEAIGSEFKGQKVGSFGDIATFSFYGNKTITTGEGGMCTTNDETLHDRMVHFKGQGLAKYRQYWHDVIGYNYRMTNICAAIGLAQMEQVEGVLKRKRRIADQYKSLLDSELIHFHGEHKDVYHSYWMCSIIFDKSVNRDKIRDELQANGIETRPLFYPVHTMPMYNSNFERHRIAEDLGWRGINLPSYPALEPSDVEFISDTIKNAVYTK